MKKYYQLLITQLKVTTRNRSALFFTLVFPLVFIGVFGLAFQQSDPATSTIPIALINNDNGIPNSLNVYNVNGTLTQKYDYSNTFIDILSSITFEDNITKVFELVNFTNKDDAMKSVERAQEKALVIIPDDFALGFLAAIRKSVNNETLNWNGYPSPDYQTQIDVIGDNSLVQFNIVTSVINSVVSQYFALGQDMSNGHVVIASTVRSKGLTTFDYVVPGLVIFAIISNANTVAAMALSDVESKLLDRLRLSRVKKWEYPAALVSSQIVVSFVQIPILFGTALLFGFPLSSQLGIAFMFAMFVSIAMSGIGLLMAAFFKNAESAGGLASIITTPMAFFAGAFFTMPNPQILPAGVIGSTPFGLFDLLPPTRSITALRLVIFNNYSIVDVLPDLFITATLGIVYLALGIFFYSRKHLTVQ